MEPDYLKNFRGTYLVCVAASFSIRINLMFESQCHQWDPEFLSKSALVVGDRRGIRSI